MQTSALSSDRTLQRLRQRLDSWALEHLRAHAAELANRIEALEAEIETTRDEARRAWAAADQWHDDHMTLLHEMMDMGAQVGITRDGEVLVSPPTEAALAGLAAGEIHAGTLSIPGQAPYHLILMPGQVEDATWEAAAAWAASIGGELPNRIEQALLFAHQRKGFEADIYWSSARHESDPDYAWYQDFDLGGQDNDHRDGQLRARAVRRLPI